MTEPDFWQRTEEEYQKAKQKEAIEQAKRNQRLAEKIQEVKQRVPESTKEQLKERIQAQAPSRLGLGLDCPKKDEHWIEAEANRILDEMATPIALRELEEKRKERVGFKKTNPMEEMASQAQCRKWLEEAQQNLPKIRTQRNTTKKTPIEKVMLDPAPATVLSSYIKTNNGFAWELLKSGIQIHFFEALPMDKARRSEWLRDLYNGVMLSDEQLQQAERKITQALRNLDRVRL